MQTWHLHSPPKEREEKQFIRYFTLLLAASGLRFGEARGLRWRHLSVRKDEDGKAKYLRLDFEEGKTGGRVVVSRRPDLYEKLRNLSKYTKPNDYVFVDNETGKQIVKDLYYDYWHKMLKDTKLAEGTKKIVFYCLRHTYATWRLYGGVDIYDLALNMGTSVHFIEQHYGHVKVDKKWESLVGNINKHDMAILLGD